MRLTVGPLPSAVYWRRRAVVLGALLLFLIVLVYSCTGPDPGKPDRTANPGPTAGATPTTPLLTPETGAPEGGPSAASTGNPPEATGEPAGGGPAGGGPGGGEPTAGALVPPPPPAVENGCTDEEMSVTPVPSRKSAGRGESIEIRLRIKNVSNRTCNRDVGANSQELYIKTGARKIWSSDVCSTVRANDVRSFGPGVQTEYTISWNGKDDSDCANGLANGPNVPAGSYELFGRLGTKYSEPVKLTVTG